MSRAYALEYFLNVGRVGQLGGTADVRSTLATQDKLTAEEFHLPLSGLGNAFPPSLFLVFSSSSPAVPPSLPPSLSFSLCVSLSASLSFPASLPLSLSLLPPPPVLLEQWLGAAETAGSWGCPRSLIRAAWELGWGKGTGDYKAPCEATASAVFRAGMQHP